ncbi:MAG: retention module-containing protein [Geobacter sp.]|nr:MAG: retention module-containing protein [Geobacter sp.]
MVMAQNTHAATAGAGNQVVGKVVILYGTVKAISPDGAVRLLMPNSPIYANDRIVTESDGSASIVFNGAQDNHLDLGRMTNVTIDHDVYATVTPEEVSDAVSEVEQIQQALLTGDQPIELEAPAAGGPVSAGGTHPLFVVAPTGAEVTPTSGLTTTGVTFGTTATIEAAGTDAVSTPTVPTTNTIVVTGPADVNEGGEITYTANVSHPAQGDITVNLSNGSSIIIPNGATSGSVHIPVHPDNPYIDAGTVTTSVTSAAGGTENIVVDHTPVVTQVHDVPTPTIAHITAVDHSITENAENAAIFNIHLDNAPQGAASVDVQIVDSHTGLTTVQNVALDANGDGQLVYNSAHPDAYVDPSTVTATITEVHGGNYEAPVTGASDTVNVTDITPPGPEVTTVHVTASAPEVNEDQTNAAIFNIHLDNAPQGAASVDVQIVDTNTGLTTVQTLALDANGNAQLVYNSADPDVYLDHTSVTATVTAVNGGGYEQTSVAGATATVDVVDTLTPTMAHITAVDHSITENAENAAIFNIHLDNAPQGAASVDVQIVDSHTGLTTVQTVALDANGDGQLVYNSAHPDAYVDPSTVTATITEVHGGNYEAPVTGASDTVNVIDITPPGPEVTTVHVTAASPEVNEDQTNAAIFNIHLDNAPQGAASVDVQIVDTNTGLTTVQTLALDANGNAQLVYNSADPDVYLDHTSVTATVTAVNGGGYEQTSVAGATATVGVVDTIDQTAVDISTTTPIISEHDTQVTFNIHLENAPQGAASASVNIYDSFTGVTKTETVILDADGNGSLTVAPANSATASITATVTAINGGNYEGVDLTGAHATASVDHGITLTPVGVTVSEANLPDGTSPSAASLAQTGSLTITALDGVSTVHIGNTDISISALHNLGTSDSISIDGVMYGHMEVTGYTDTATGGTLQYSFTLNDNVLTPPASVESYLEQVSVGVTDANGSVANSSLGITIVDDHPTFTLIDHAIVGNENSSTAGVLYGNHDINFGADSIGSISVVGDSLSGKLSYEYTTHADGSVTAAAYSSTNHTADTHFFDLTINTDGTYAFDMVNARATFASGNISLLNVNGGAATNSFVLNDATFNAIDTNHSGSIGNAEQLKPTASGFGVGNGNVDVGEQFNVTFANGIAVDSISLYSKVQAAGSLTMSYETKYFNPDGTEGHDSGSATLDSNGLMHFDPVHDFTSITFTVTSGTGKLDSFSFSERLIPNDETLHFQVSATDGDGDVSGTHPLDVTLLGVHPAGTLIAGTTGNDAIIGTSGDDVISGGAGHNTLTGGAGADTFKVGAGDDTIKDFTANQDKIVIEPTHTDALFAHDQGTNTAHLTITNNGAPVGTVTFENVGDTAAADNLLNSLLNDDPTVHK